MGMGMGMGVSFQYPMDMSMGVGMIFENRYKSGYRSTRPIAITTHCMFRGTFAEVGGMTNYEESNMTTNQQYI